MQIKKFGEKATGTLKPVSECGHAFIPFPLPPDWKLPNHLWPKLAEADKHLGILEGLGRTLPNPGLLLRPLSRRESIQSSRLEGTYATPKQLLLFEMNPSDSSGTGEQTNDWREVLNYARALDYGTASQLPLSLRLIRDIHRILMDGVRGKDKTPGEFRTIQVAIGNRLNPRFVPPPAENLLECLDTFEKYLNIPEPVFHPLIDCFLAHYQFETVHPFMDGNGRVGRLLFAIMIQRKCQLSKPWLYLSGFFEQQREEYVNRLLHVSTDGDWTGWVEYCLQATISQAKDTIERCERLRAAREKYIHRAQSVGGTMRLTQIVEALFHSPFVEIRRLKDELGVTYPTAKADVDRLVGAGILRELENVPYKTFYAPEVYEITYSDIDE